MIVINNFDKISSVNMKSRPDSEKLSERDFQTIYDSYLLRTYPDEYKSKKQQTGSNKLTKIVSATLLALGITMTPLKTSHDVKPVEIQEVEIADVKPESESVKEFKKEVFVPEVMSTTSNTDKVFNPTYFDYIADIKESYPQMVNKYSKYDSQKVFETVLDMAKNPNKYRDYEQDYILHLSLHYVGKTLKTLDTRFREYTNNKESLWQYIDRHTKNVPNEVIPFIPHLEARKNISNSSFHNVMQIIPEAQEHMNNVFNSKIPLNNEFLPDNIKLGVQLIEYYTKEFNGDIIKGLAAYNSGDNTVRKYDGVPPFSETQNYVNFVRMHLDFFEKYPDAFECMFKFRKQ